MPALEKIELAVVDLPEKEYSQFRSWFMEYDWNKWDQQIETDSDSGKLDFLLEQAIKAKEKGNLVDL